jgi:hypothetical protein
MVPEVVLEVVLVFGHKNTLGAEEQFLWLDVSWGAKGDKCHIPQLQTLSFALLFGEQK